MKLTRTEIKMIKKGTHPFYIWRPKPKVWKKHWKRDKYE